MSPRLLATLALLTASCAGAEHFVAIDLRTDLVVGEEIDRITLFLDGTQVADGALAPGDYAAGVRVAELDAVTTGAHRIRVEVSLDGAPVATQVMAVQVREPGVFTALITRDCRGVDCGAGVEAQACLRAACVAPECTPETPEACPEAECAADEDCASAVMCVAAACRAGRCLAVDDGSCGEGEYCDPDDGCALRRGAELEPLEVLVSDRADRGAPRPLDGAELAERAYVFVPDQPGITVVHFLVDEPRDGRPPQTSSVAPYDLVPSMTSGPAEPLFTSLLSPGAHTFIVEAEYGDGSTAEVTGTFTTVATSDGLLFSTLANRDDPRPLDGAAVAGDVFVFWGPGTRDDVRAVSFYLDDSARVGEPAFIEYRAPWDFNGSEGPYGVAHPLDTNELDPGPHVITIVVDRGSGDEVIEATFTVP